MSKLSLTSAFADAQPSSPAHTAPQTTFLWLEITGKCQLACSHCYADSSPQGTHGQMTTEDWLRLIDQAAELGVDMVQFIGGEPTLYPGLRQLVERALSHGLEVEIFSNLYAIRPDAWELFARPGVRLATSYYSDAHQEHDRITTRRGSHQRTTAAIEEALRRQIPLRVGIIGVEDGQHVQEAYDHLAQLGVQSIGVDYLRQVGRGIRDSQASADQLCGNCANGVLAVNPEGDVSPCVFSRWLTVGNVRSDSLATVLTGVELAQTRADLQAGFAARQSERNAKEKPKPAPKPKPCHPQCQPACQPTCSPSCSPSCHPRRNCGPSGNCWPKYS